MYQNSFGAGLCPDLVVGTPGLLTGTMVGKKDVRKVGEGIACREGRGNERR